MKGVDVKEWMELLCRAIFGAAVVGLLRLHEGEPASCLALEYIVDQRATSRYCDRIIFFLCMSWEMLIFTNVSTNSIVHVESWLLEVVISIIHAPSSHKHCGIQALRSQYVL
jgi:hypothetical protein